MLLTLQVMDCGVTRVYLMEAAGKDSITVDKSLKVSLTISLSHVFS